MNAGFCKRTRFVTQRDWKTACTISCGRLEGLREPEQCIAAALENVRGIRATDHEHAIAERQRATEIALRLGIGRCQRLDTLPAGCGQNQNQDLAIFARARNTDERELIADGDRFAETEIVEIRRGGFFAIELCDQHVFRQVA